MIGTIINPNFTIVAPGGCNAKCNFCFWRQEKTGSNYMEKLKNTIDGLPSQFYMISISGGEPTLSPYLSQILDLIDTNRFTHRILTTNGTKLKKFIPQISEKIQHINISRHHWDEQINQKIFETKTVPDKDYLIECIDALNMKGVDVTFSAVLTNEYILTKEDVIQYVNFAKECGASKIFLRKKHEDLMPHPLEAEFGESKIIMAHDCPACRTRVQLIKGIEVHWKTSVLEPSGPIDDVLFETIFHPSAVMTKDWEGSHIINPLKIIDTYVERLVKNSKINFDPITGEKL